MTPEEGTLPLAGRVAIVTGSSSGIGRAVAAELAGRGMTVVVTSRSEQRARATAAAIEDDGGAALGVAVELTDEDGPAVLVQRALDAFGRIDVVFANAGFGGPRGFDQGDVEEWKAMVLTNVYGAALTIRATMEPLKASKGHLLLTGSVAGRRALKGSLYSATKWAVTGMGEAARQDFNDTGVRVTLIEPGMVDTPFFDSPPQIEALEPDDIARAVLFAVSQPPRVDVNEMLVRPTAQPS
jgi:NADP-dependent 3-hydroxy acid dehydrogenase YdfG